MPSVPRAILLRGCRRRAAQRPWGRGRCVETASIQIEIFLLTGIGFFCGRRDMLSSKTREQLIDLLFAVILPASILDSFQVELTPTVIEQTLGAFLVSCGIQVFYWLWNHVFYRGTSPDHRVCLRYATMVSNAGLIGMPIAAAYFGSRGLLLASIFLIPQRVFMWSYGLSMFTDSSGRDVLRKLATHPCIVSIGIGIGVMGLYTAGIQLPAPVTATVSALSDCSTALGMMAVGGILSDCRLRDVVNREVLTYSLYRLVLIPLCVAGLLLALPVDPLTAQVSILLTAMPAASTTAMLAAKYRGDAPFASELVLSSTLLSLVTVPGVCTALSLVW